MSNDVLMLCIHTMNTHVLTLPTDVLTMSTHVLTLPTHVLTMSTHVLTYPTHVFIHARKDTDVPVTCGRCQFALLGLWTGTTAGMCRRTVNMSVCSTNVPACHRFTLRLIQFDQLIQITSILNHWLHKLVRCYELRAKLLVSACVRLCQPIFPTCTGE